MEIWGSLLFSKGRAVTIPWPFQKGEGEQWLTLKLNDPKTWQPQNLTTPKLDNSKTWRSQNSMTPKLDDPKTWQPQNLTTPKHPKNKVLQQLNLLVELFLYNNKYRKGTTMRPNWHDLFHLYIWFINLFICFIYSICYFIIWYFD